MRRRSFRNPLTPLGSFVALSGILCIVCAALIAAYGRLP
jgi:hypothetical protein